MSSAPSPSPEPTSTSTGPGPHVVSPVAAPPALDGRQIFFLFVGSALAACLIFALGVTVGRRVEQRAVAREKANAGPSDPLAVLDDIANAEEALTFHRAVLNRPTAGQNPPGAAPSAERSPRYALHSSTFAQRAPAEELLRRLRETGYKARLIEVTAAGERTTYRLQIGDFPSASSEGISPIRSDLLRRFGLATTVARGTPASPTD